MPACRGRRAALTGVTAQPTAGAASVTLLSDVDYLPFGPAKQFTFGNTRTLTKTYDQNYAIDSVVDSGTAGVDIGYGVDEVGNITALGELLDSGTVATRTVAYDGLNRVESLLDGSTTVQGFTYDATGNRLSKTSGGTTASYTYQIGTHRLTNDGTAARTYDAAGHGTAIGTKTFACDDHGRQVEYSSNGVLTRKHLYNAFGARVARWHVLNPINDMVFVYDEAGHIIGEYRTDGTRIREYVWMDDTPIAVLMTAGGSTHQYILTDHLNTPRAVVDPTSNAIIWRWDITTTAFGEHVADGDPDGDGNGYTLNLRYPGQFFDSITGVHYNYFRDYDPGVGRYLQSDPIGLAAGTSTFSYVRGQPFRFSDPTGLRPPLPEEAALVRSVFGSCFDTDQLNVVSPETLPETGRGFSLWGNMVGLPTSYFIGGDPHKGLQLSSPIVRRKFIHEVAHVWQRQNGASVSLSMAVPQALASLGIGDPYDYGWAPMGENPADYSEHADELFRRGHFEAHAQFVEDSYHQQMWGYPNVQRFMGVRNHLRGDGGECGCGPGR